MVLTGFPVSLRLLGKENPAELNTYLKNDLVVPKFCKICRNCLEISFYKWYPLFNRGSRSATLGAQMVQVSLGYYLLGLWGVEVKRCGWFPVPLRLLGEENPAELNAYL